MRCQGSWRVDCFIALLHRFQCRVRRQGGIQQQGKTDQAETLRRNLICGSWQASSNRGRKACRVALSALPSASCTSFIHGISCSASWVFQLLPLPAHRTGNAQQHQQFLAQATDGPRALAAKTAFEPGMFTLGIHRDDPTENFQQAFARLAVPGQCTPVRHSSRCAMPPVPDPPVVARPASATAAHWRRWRTECPG